MPRTAEVIAISVETISVRPTTASDGGVVTRCSSVVTRRDLVSCAHTQHLMCIHHGQAQAIRILQPNCGAGGEVQSFL